MVNRVELNGFAGINPEINTTKEGVKVAHFTLATTENYKNRSGEWVKDTTWHKIVMWNKLADQAVATIKKGSRINLSGKLVNRSYTDSNGNKRYATEVHAYSFEAVIAEERQPVAQE
ncbi:MAG: single-stranded DNA-binding protein [Bacteroidia bacterium]|nr:single-stranded DNA-binding protein [Bacteroidia bacterium]